MTSKRKEVYWSVDSSPSDSLGLLTNDVGNKRARLHSTVTAPQAKKKTSRRSTLKTLCPEDKHKVKQLIEDLAKTGAEKDAIEQLLRKERNEFGEKLSQLQLDQQNLLEERTRLERSLHDSELKLQAIKSENDKLGKVKSIPVFHSASVGSWSHDHSAPPTTVVNLDHSLNYLLHSANSNVQPPERPTSSISSSSLTSSLHTADLTPLQQPLNQQPPEVVNNSVPQPRPLIHTESHSSACSDVGVQTITVTHTAVQTDQYNVIPAVTPQQSVITVTSSEFDQKMEHMMATALLNAKDTVNTIEALSQSLLLKNISRESSFMTVPLHQPLTSTQCVANNEGVVNSQEVAYNKGVTNSQDVANTPRMTTSQEPGYSHAPQGYTSNQMDTRTHVTPSGHTPKSPAGHMITPPQHSYTLYDTGCHHKNATLYLDRDDELQLEDLAETLNSSTIPTGWLQNHYLSAASTSCGRKNSSIAMATQPVGEHLIVDHSDSDVINDLFFLQ